MRKKLFSGSGVFVVILTLTISILWMGQPAFAAKTLRVGVGMTDLKTLDPGYISTTQDMLIVDMVTDGLLRFKPGDASVIENDLAEKFEVSDDGMTMTFTLHKGVMSHPFKGYPDGVELTAEDIAFTIAKNSDKKTSAASSMYANFETEIVDKYTIKIRTKKRVPSPERLLVDFKAGNIIPEKAYKAIGAKRFKNRPVGFGPFRITNYIPGQKVSLEAHKNYWRGAPKLDRVDVLFMPELNSREFALERGQVQIVDGAKQQQWVEKIEKMKGITPAVIGPGELAIFNLNTSKPPLDNLKVRQALSLAIDLNELLEIKGHKIADILCGLMSPEMPGGLTCESAAAAGVSHVYDPGKARRLLKEAGLENGFTLGAIISSERDTFKLPLQNLQAQWKKIGVNVSINVVDHSTFHTKIRRNASPVVLYICSRPSSDIWLTGFYHSASIVATGAKPITNFSHCSIVDAPIEDARAETDKDKQNKLWENAQIKILKDALVIPAYIQKQVWGISDTVQLNYELKSSYTTAPQINELTDIVD